MRLLAIGLVFALVFFAGQYPLCLIDLLNDIVGEYGNLELVGNNLVANVIISFK